MRSHEEEVCLPRLSSGVFGQFINFITSEQQNVGEGIQSCTRDVSVVSAKVGGKPIVVIDTPGIDDTHTDVNEADVFSKIANLLGPM